MTNDSVSKISWEKENEKKNATPAPVQLTGIEAVLFIGVLVCYWWVPTRSESERTVSKYKKSTCLHSEPQQLICEHVAQCCAVETDSPKRSSANLQSWLTSEPNRGLFIVCTLDKIKSRTGR